MIDNNFTKSDLDLAEELGVDILNIEYPKDDQNLLELYKELAGLAHPAYMDRVYKGD